MLDKRPAARVGRLAATHSKGYGVAWSDESEQITIYSETLLPGFRSEFLLSQEILQDPTMSIAAWHGG